MGQKVNPHGLRVGVIKDWDSRWYAREDKVGDLIVEDYNIRKYLKSTLYSAGIAKIEIERDNAKVKISIHCSRPGVIIGKAGRTRHMGIRPTVRGSVMNPNDHPHGGGEGKSPVGHPGPMTPWGKPAMGLKTRKTKNRTNKYIFKRRNAK